jgi:ketosteroid isomerase-like protein
MKPIGRVVVCALLGFLASSGAPAEGQKPDVRAELMEADRAFAKAAADKGLDGWMSVMVADAARLPKLGESFIVGLAAIRKADAAIFANPNRKLTWEPADAYAFDGAAHGITTGRYQILLNETGKESVMGTGAYVTFWRKVAGKWVVIFDTGAPDAQKK